MSDNGKFASPWQVGEYGMERFEDFLIEDGRRIVWGADGMEVCLVRDRGGMVPDIARLIAAAPELLEALRRVVLYAVLHPAGNKAMTKAFDIARAAIAKAEGME